MISSAVKCFQCYLLYFCNIAWWWPRWMAKACRIYDKEMDVRTVILLY